MNKPDKREGFVKNEPLDEPMVDAIDAVEPPGFIEGEASEEPVAEMWPVTVRLMYKPVRNNKGEMVHELKFREPTGNDIIRYGNPCHINQDGDVVILERKMMTMIAALSGILQPFIEGMDPRDWNSCAYRLRGFFIPNLAAW